MYEELVKTLRYYGAWEKHSKEAADAIEELSAKYQKALSDLVKQAEPPEEE